LLAILVLAGKRLTNGAAGWQKRYIRNYAISQASTGNSGCYFTVISDFGSISTASRTKMSRPHSTIAPTFDLE
jgi:hypothetical protein